MAENPINPPLPADLPEDWAIGQTVAPSGPRAEGGPLRHRRRTRRAARI